MRADNPVGSCRWHLQKIETVRHFVVNAATTAIVAQGGSAAVPQIAWNALTS